jgi:Signal transduction histidine kinase
MEINNLDYTILIVDDIKANVMLLKALIKKHGYNVIEASNGKECLDKLYSQNPDMILMDVMMPILDGFETLERIRKGTHHNDIPVVMITALDNKDDIVKGFTLGADDYISKPFNNDELLVRIRHIIELLAARRDLLYTMKNRDRLYSVIAHDLRSPLSSIKMILNLLVTELDGGKISNEYYDMLNEVNRTSEELFILLDNLLKWTKTQIGKTNVVIQEIDLNGLIKGLEELYKLMSQNKNIKITLDTTNERVIVKSDSDMVKTIIRNLLSNAIKFSFEDSEIIIHVKDTTEEVIVCVEDHGCGINEENQHTLLVDKNSSFTSFGTKNEEGSGLGLNLCREFVKKINGRLWFESIEGEGSKFSFSIPKKESEIPSTTIIFDQGSTIS